MYQPHNYTHIPTFFIAGVLFDGAFSLWVIQCFPFKFPFFFLLLVMQSYTYFMWKSCFKIIAKFSEKHLRESTLEKNLSKVHSSQRRIHNLIKHRRWSFLLKKLAAFSFQSLTTFPKSSNLDVWQSCKYASASKFGEVFQKSYSTELLWMAASVWPQFLMEGHIIY